MLRASVSLVTELEPTCTKRGLEMKRVGWAIVPMMLGAFWLAGCSGAQVAELNTQLTEANEKIVDLEKQVADLTAERDAMKTAMAPVKKATAKATPKPMKKSSTASGTKSGTAIAPKATPVRDTNIRSKKTMGKMGGK